MDDELHSNSCSITKLQASVWDSHDIQLSNTDISQFLESTPPSVSFLESGYSSSTTGYLQDAFFKFSSKRSRLLLFPHVDEGTTYKECSGNNENLRVGMSMSSCDTMSAEIAASVTTIIEDSYPLVGIKTPGDPFSAPQELVNYSSSSSSTSWKDSITNDFISDNKEVAPCMDPSLCSGSRNERRKKRKLSTQVAYPFAVIKPGGYEGDATLDEINEKILMPPTRPVKHPVGDFVCRPLVASPNEPGLSGKPVVAMQRIQTQGRGTITILRTRG